MRCFGFLLCLIMLFPLSGQSQEINQGATDRGRAEDCYEQGLDHFMIEEYDNALECFNEVIALNPGYAEAYFHRGCTLKDMGDYEAALADFDKAIELKPDYATAYYRQGQIYRDLEETDDAYDDLEKLRDETELKDLSSDALADTLVENDDTDDIDLQMEDLMIEDSGLDEAVIDDAQDDILGDIDLKESIEENILSSDDEILDELDNELENSLLLSDDESGEESLLESETAAGEDQTGTADFNFDEIDDIPLDGESLEELLTESDQDEAGENKFDTIDLDDLTVDDGNLIEAGGDISESDETPEPLDDLFSGTELQESTDDSGSGPEGALELLADEDQSDTDDETADLTLDDTIEDIGTEDLFSEEAVVSAPVEESVFPNDSKGELIEEAGPVEDSIISEEMAGDVLEEESSVEEDLPAASDDGPDDVIDTLAMESPEVMEALPSDNLQTVEESTEAIPQIPVISEEKVEQIVREVVGEVVERIAREVFTEVAEKVITEAIDSLQKSLGSDSE